MLRVSSNVWDKLWKRRRSQDIFWYADEFLHHLLCWTRAKQYHLFLEPGAGSGRFSVYLAKKGLEVVALDVSPYSVILMQSIKRKKTALLHIVRADIQHTPFRNNVFDAVFNEGVVEHFSEPYPILNEMARVTRRLGTIILGVPNIFSFHTLGKFITSGSTSISKPYGFEKSYSKNQINSMFQLLRLKEIEVHGVGLFYGIARYMPSKIYQAFYLVYRILRDTELGAFLTEFFGFQIVGKGVKP